MTDEEKKAIELLKGLCSDDCINKDIVDTIVSLIEKQQKEIEHQKEQRKFWRNEFYKQQKEIEELKEKTEYYKIENSIRHNALINISRKVGITKNAIVESMIINAIDNNFVSKDKIREIIYPSPNNYIPVEVQMSEMYRKIENLLKESEINENN